MKKYFAKFAALSLAAILGVGMLAACGSQNDEETTSGEVETTQKEDAGSAIQEVPEKEPADEATTSTDIE